jgi:hypothetical protein
MPDEHESAIAAWLDSVSTRRELTILGDRFPHWTEYERYSFALQMEMLVALDTYELPDITPPEDPDEPWKPRAA